MKTMMIFLLVFFMPSITLADETVDNIVRSLRGDVSLSETNKAPEPKRWQRDRQPYSRAYLQQPPMIPHNIKGYKINHRSNKCLTCHAWDRYKISGATKISLTHFIDRDGVELDHVSPRRYFCVQCHVPQSDATPLVENNFKPIKGIGR